MNLKIKMNGRMDRRRTENALEDKNEWMSGW